MRISDWSSDVCSSDLQQHVDMIGVEPAEAALQAAGEVVGREPVGGDAVLELLSHLADDHPAVALAAQQPAETLLAAAIGRGGVERSEERRAGRDWVGTGRSRWPLDQEKKKTTQ